MDALISASAAENYLRDAPCSARDQLAITRLIKALCHLAVGAPRYSARAVDHIAILARWDPEQACASMNSLPTGRRLARALDRSLRTWMRKDVEVADDKQPGPGGADAAFNRLFQVVAHRCCLALKGTHNATTSSAALLRLARLVPMYYREDIKEERVAAKTAAELLETICRDPHSDILLRREALWYLFELTPWIESLEPRGHGLESAWSVAATLPQAEKEQMQDILDTLGGDLEEHLMNEPLKGAEYRRKARHGDLVTDPTLTAYAWKTSQASFGEFLDRHLSLERRPAFGTWRSLTKQIALPTRDLLRELLVTPSSGRARTTAEALRAAGHKVTDAVIAACDSILRDSDALSHLVVARRPSGSLAS